jgi:membrane AbrB-like protein
MLFPFSRFRQSLLLPSLPSLIITARTLAAALAGGTAAWLLGLPAPWLSGSVIVVTILSLTGIDTRMPPRLFEIAIVLIGLMLGVGVTPDLLGRVGSWPLSLVGMVVSIAVIQLSVSAFLTRVGGWDKASAFFGGLPGALSYVLAVAAGTHADLRKVAVGQSIRVLLLIAVLPSIVVAVGHPTGVRAVLVASPFEIAVMLVAGIAAAFVLYRLRFPGALLAGGLAASGILHGGGWVVGTLPPPVVVAAFVVLGAFVGARFAGADLALLRRISAVSFGAFLLATAIAAFFALAVATITGIQFAQVLIAFAPGGLDAMTSLAIALNMDSAYVATHQLLRFLLIALFVPIAARRWIVADKDRRR